MTQVLYRKYRPTSFSEVEGQEHVVKTLQGALSLGRVSHAYLFAGPRGSGKTTIARLLAKALNCEKGKGNICGVCKHCEGSAIDLVEMDAASNRGIDEIRNLRESARSAPLEGKYKIFLIDEVHMLTKDAFNALLKILEEPPEHVIFILATTEPYKILPTVLSRVQRFDFRRLSIQQIENKLKRVAKQEKVKIPNEVFNVLALNADGSLRDAESNLAKLISFVGDEVTLEDAQNILGVIPIKMHQEFIETIINKNSEEGIRYINNMYESGIDLPNFTDSLLEYLRKMMVLRSAPSTVEIFSTKLTPEHLTMVQEQANRLSIKNLAVLVAVFAKAKENLKSSPIPQLPLELAFLESLDTIKDE